MRETAMDRAGNGNAREDAADARKGEAGREGGAENAGGSHAQGVHAHDDAAGGSPADDAAAGRFPARDDFALGDPARSERERARDRAAARILQHYHAKPLPPILPGEAASLAAAYTAAARAPALIAELAQLYGYEVWDRDAFADAYARALAAWKGDLAVRTEDGKLILSSLECPLEREVARDARVCTMCRSLHEQLTRLAMPGAVDELVWSSVPQRGEGDCEFRIRFR